MAQEFPNPCLLGAAQAASLARSFVRSLSSSPLPVFLSGCYAPSLPLLLSSLAWHATTHSNDIHCQLSAQLRQVILGASMPAPKMTCALEEIPANKRLWLCFGSKKANCPNDRPAAAAMPSTEAGFPTSSPVKFRDSKNLLVKKLGASSSLLRTCLTATAVPVLNNFNFHLAKRLFETGFNFTKPLSCNRL